MRHGSSCFLQADTISILVYTYYVLPLRKLTRKTKMHKGVLSEGTAAMDGNQAVVFQWISKIVSNHKVVEQIAESAGTDPVFQSIKPFLNNYSKGAH